MSKLVTYNPETRELTCLTTLASEPIDKVIIACKDSYPKEFKPVELKCYGYNMYELYLTAIVLREHNITELELNNFAKAFELGYTKAYNEAKESIEQSVNKLFEDLGGR